MSTTQHLFAITISAKRKPGMGKEEYHQYISKTHVGHLKDLLQHNTTETLQDLGKLFSNLPSVNVSPYDAFIQIVFRDVQDYINMKNDPHYMQVVNPDHVNFADQPNTMMSCGWYEKHVVDGKLV